MNRIECLKLSAGLATLLFLAQIVLLVVNIRFVDRDTGQFRLGAELRFKFVDETTRQFVLVSQLEKLPGELMQVVEVAVAFGLGSFLALGLYGRYRTAVPSFGIPVDPGDSSVHSADAAEGRRSQRSGG